jgi:uncharacterized membrane protein
VGLHQSKVLDLILGINLVLLIFPCTFGGVWWGGSRKEKVGAFISSIDID